MPLPTGQVEVRYLGFHLGHGQVSPQIDPMAVIVACMKHKTKKEGRQFLGLAEAALTKLLWMILGFTQ